MLSIVKISQNTEKSPGELRRLAVTQTPMKDDQLKICENPQISIISLNNILMKCTRRYKVSKSQEKVNHLMYMNDTKLLGKNKKRNGNLITGNKNIHSRKRDAVWQRKMRHANNEKRKKKHMEEMEQPN